MTRLLRLGLLGAFSFGCVGGSLDGGGAGRPDGGGGGGGGGGGDGGASAGCAVEADYGALGAVSGESATQENQPGSMGTRHVYRMKVALPGSGALPDELQVQLWDNYGAFLGGVAAPGTYPISGPETSVDTCGVCVIVFADVDPTAGPASAYIAQAGSVQVDSITTSFTGAVSGVPGFQHFNDDTGTVINDGCTTQLQSADFDSAITITGGGGGGGGGGG